MFDKTDLWVEVIENPNGFQSVLMAHLLREIPSVDLQLGGGENHTVVWVRGPEHAVKYFLYLLRLEEYRTEHAYDPEPKLVC